MDMVVSSIEAKMTRRGAEKVFRIRWDPGNVNRKKMWNINFLKEFLKCVIIKCLGSERARDIVNLEIQYDGGSVEELMNVTMA